MHEGTSVGSSFVRLLAGTTPGPAISPIREWHGRGLCIGEDPAVFFPSNGALGSEARDICASCAVRQQCLSYATAADESGIWGGLDQDERRNLKRRQRRQASAGRAEESTPDGRAGAA
jgi:Transcription factor WhiB